MYKKATLRNGVRIVTNDIKDRDSISIGFWVDVGGRYEEGRLKGAAHFLEHILFKGSRNYSCEEIKIKSSKDLFLQLDGEPIPQSKTVNISINPLSLKVLVPNDLPRPLFSKDQL